MPLISTIIGLAAAATAAGTGVAGVVEGAQAGDRQQKALTQQEQIAQQEMTDKQASFKQLTDFFSPYLKEGSPFLKLIQQASAGTTATGANNAVGAIRNTVGASGVGFGPSGTEGEAIASEGAQTNATSSSNYLSNLLNNEAVKFQAAQGINAAGTMAGSGQNQPGVTADLNSLNAPSLGNGLSGLSKILQGLITPGGGTSGTFQVGPNAAQGQATLNQLGKGIGGMDTSMQLPGLSGSPTTQGWSI